MSSITPARYCARGGTALPLTKYYSDLLAAICATGAQLSFPPDGVCFLFAPTSSDNSRVAKFARELGENLLLDLPAARESLGLKCLHTGHVR
jgi:hypothetical protein